MSASRVVSGLAAIARPPPRAVVTVGVFDGVHTAHQQLVRTAVRIARRVHGTCVVITFHPDPQTVLDPSHAQPALMPLAARVERLRALGADWVWIIPFTRRFARISAEQFIRQVLIRRLRARTLVVGERFVFGRNRRGDMEVLRSISPRLGMRVVPVRHIRRAGMPVSSSGIRALIGKGQLAQARRLLGSPPALYGIVVRGAGRGRSLGFPTANIQLIPQVLPPTGVYVVTLTQIKTKRTWPGVMNLGIRPTFGAGPMVCEVHVLGAPRTLLGRTVTVSLLRRFRGERCFASPQALRRQIGRDVARARQFFQRPGPSRTSPRIPL